MAVVECSSRKCLFSLFLLTCSLFTNASNDLASINTADLAQNVNFIVELNTQPKTASSLHLSKAQNAQQLAQRQQHVIRSVHRVSPSIVIDANYNTVLNGFSGKGKRADIQALQRLPMVKRIHIVEDKTLPPLDKIAARGAYLSFRSGADQTTPTGLGVTVAVLDSGVDYTHPALGGCFGPACKVVGGYNFIDNNHDPMDENGHGTHVAGIIAAQGQNPGIAPDAKILAYKVCTKTCPVSAILQAFEHALDPDGDPNTDDGADIINMSLGGKGDIDSPLTIAVNNVVKKGVTVVVSAGNVGALGPQTIGSPGNAELAITVGSSGSYDNTKAVSEFSSQGPILSHSYQKPDIIAPGYMINSLALNSSDTTMSGTSMAAPHVAGLASLLKEQRPTLSPLEIKSLIVAHSYNKHAPFAKQGNGQMSITRALNAKLLPFQSQVMIGKLNRDGDVHNSEHSVAIKNISDEPVTLKAHIKVPSDQTNISYSIDSTSSLTLAPNATHRFKITVKSSKELDYASDFLHEAQLVIEHESAQLYVPIIMLDAIEYTINSQQLVKELWLKEHDNSGSYTDQYITQTQYLLRPGQYTLNAWYSLADKEAIVVKTLDIKDASHISISTAQAPHKIKVQSWLDHQGASRDLNELEGFGVFFDIANKSQQTRWSKFFDLSNNGMFVSKPLFSSSIPQGNILSFSLMYGDTASSADDYHLYAWSQSIDKLDGNKAIELDGSSSSTVFSVSAQHHNEFKWLVYNNLETIRDDTPFNSNTLGVYTSGRAFAKALSSAHRLSQPLSLTVHGNPQQSTFANSYKYQLTEQKTPYKYVTTPTFNFEQAGVKQRNHATIERNFNIDWQALVIDAHQAGFDSQLVFRDELKSHNNLQYSDYIDDSVLVCDQFIVAKRQYTSSTNGNLFGTTTAHNKVQACQNSQFITYANSYLANTPSLIASQLQLNNNEQQARINVVKLDYQSISQASIPFHYLVENDDSLQGDVKVLAELNINGQWHELDVTTLSKSIDDNGSLVKTSIDLPEQENTQLATLRIKLFTNTLHKTIWLTDSIVVGGTLEELFAQDSDNDGINDAQDRDADNDGMTNGYEFLNNLNPYDPTDAKSDLNKNGISNLAQFEQNTWSQFIESTVDSDLDGYVDLRDLFPNDPNEWADFDKDGTGDNADTDDDNDGFVDNQDAFPYDANEWLDSDQDSIGNNSDPDDDNDGYLDAEDAFPTDPSEWLDTDLDGRGNNIDNDDDNDGFQDHVDAFPLDANEWLDSDQDGVGNNADNDDDNDGFIDTEDAFPTDASEWLDSDSDGVGNNADNDDDNDGYSDDNDAYPLDASKWSDKPITNVTPITTSHTENGDAQAKSSGSFGLFALALLLLCLFRLNLMTNSPYKFKCNSL
ncbi:S8 family serine peptidase [Pseudoalteromonas sp. JBTF-M23]|uniref:S8 family serine peptidase n=1 Tax=Pseudoalteromonas caenipelagi TaxID=2726988 RepID=A0A849VKL4_9GAMM|nr:S8 family serine peptidase [Pseudoalteromonas caenipelagi]NOU52241.1 S8 family serine peptidase [Pseudoalteromonas caenipelagi]